VREIVVKDTLAVYRDRLVDITSKNKSLVLMKQTDKNNFDLGSLNVVSRLFPEFVLDSVFKLKNNITLFSQSSLEESHILINKKIKKLKREMDLIQQETGTYPLYVTYGFVEGYISPDFFVRCPILFYPAKISKVNIKNQSHWVLDVGDDCNPFFNKSLIMAIKKFRGIEIESFTTSAMENVPKDVDKMMDFLAELFNNFGIQFSFEKEIVVSKFIDVKKDSINKDFDKVTLLPYALLGKFQQSNNTILSDYNSLIGSELSDFLDGGLFSPDVLSQEYNEKIDENELDKHNDVESYFVLDTDASQESVVVASRQKRGIIVHGPPGTGKSQVIVNLIVDRMARGQKVLLVCQKPTALEVVYSRLGQLNLQQHVALVEDLTKDKKSIYKKISSIMEKKDVPISEDYNLFLEEKSSLSKKLNDLANSLHKKRWFNRSIHYLYGKTSNDLDNIFSATDIANQLTVDELNKFLSDFKVLINLMNKYDDENSPVFNRKSFDLISIGDALILKNHISKIINFIEDTNEVKKNMSFDFKPKFCLDHFDKLNNLKNQLFVLEDKSNQNSVICFFEEKLSQKDCYDGLREEKTLHSDLCKKISWLSQSDLPTNLFTIKEAKYVVEKIKLFKKVNVSPFKFINPVWYNVKNKLKDFFEKKGIDFSISKVLQYEEEIKSFIVFEYIRDIALKNRLFEDVPIENNISLFVSWIEKKSLVFSFIQDFIVAKDFLLDFVPYPCNYESVSFVGGEKFKEEISDLVLIAQNTKELSEEILQLQNYFVEKELCKFLSETLDGTIDASVFHQKLNCLEDFENIKQLDLMKKELSEIQEHVLNRCKKKIPIGSTNQLFDLWSNLIKNSFYRVWIDEVEKEEPHLRDVSTDIYKNNLIKLEKTIKDGRNMVPYLVNQKLTQKSKNISQSSYKKLKHESNKQRKILPIRKTMEMFYDDVMSMVPCWLCTPDVVSSIFPLQQGMFDLVIFDEASQCPIENALPSLYRANHVVIAGDEKQLPPSSFFQSTSEEEDEDEEEDYNEKQDKQAKSLLDWGKLRFTDKWLSWHYRSEYEELINFSNYAFYDKRIQIAPTVVKGSIHKPIEFISVNGVWEKNTNRCEAEKVVETVFDILKSDNSSTIGIIAFNRNQADLIQDIFEEKTLNNPDLQAIYENAKSRKNGEEHVGLFIKNIENVQGDERDIIVFSVGYAKDFNGKMISNLGPLSREGGENRLNVAISRAKKKVYIACSFEPSEWTRVETYAKGARLLKRYLEYGKAISDGNYDLAQSILNSLVDSTNIQEEHNQVFLESPLEEEVFYHLQSMGYEVHTQVGFSGYRIDLAIVNPKTKESYVLGIECDGAMYHSSKVARERDIYRQKFLESKGWKIHRIWSRNWWIDKQRELNKIQKVIESMVQEAR